VVPEHHQMRIEQFLHVRFTKIATWRGRWGKTIAMNLNAMHVSGGWWGQQPAPARARIANSAWSGTVDVGFVGVCFVRAARADTTVRLSESANWRLLQSTQVAGTDEEDKRQRKRHAKCPCPGASTKCLLCARTLPLVVRAFPSCFFCNTN